MNRSIYRLIILIILLFPFSVKANEFVSIECKEKKKEYTCMVYGIPEYPIRAMEFRYFLPSHVKESSFIFEESIFGRMYDNRIIALLKELTNEKVLIGTLKISANKKLNIEDIIISEVKVVNEDYEDIVIENQNNNVNKEESSRCLLKIIIPCGIIIIGIIIFMFIKMRRVIK